MSMIIVEQCIDMVNHKIVFILEIINMYNM